MDGFQRRRELKKNNILEAALALFMEYGIQKVSISEIAKKANVSQVTIYNYFESKHKLIQDVFIYYVDKAATDFEQIIYSDLPFPEKINKLIFAKKEVSTQIHQEFYQFMMKEYTTEGNYIEKIYIEKTIPYFKELIEDGKKQGYIDQNLSHEAILFYIKMLKDYMQQEEVYQKILPLTEDITNIFFYGICGKKET
ncbi:TetR/AcrR family transcriptional regulator [Alkalihalobacterium elongatum]|uniref:TetR/AcrR family transcriptional regulator n=1 Tax=Alkalihalobacterium elongatum TaxID=2675466 RepID=UPI001C1F8B61|nr:TetR/AcrR family transcriptional regulator [Alkalihalobacterium elongatum]